MTDKNFFTIETLVPILTKDLNLFDKDGNQIDDIIGTDKSQTNLDVLIQTLALRGQPMMLGQVIGYKGFNDGLTAVDEEIIYKVQFVINHLNVWNHSLLLAALNSSKIFVNNPKDTSDDDIVVSITTSL